MPTPPPDDETVLLDINAAFYRAFAARDFVAMEELWAKKAPVVCIHPGWPPLMGREAVLEGWRRILSNPAQPGLQMMGPRVTLWGDVALVICFEKVEDQYLIASNLFVREGKSWRLSHHQAGPVASPPTGANDDDDPESDDDFEDDEDDDDDDDIDPTSGTIH